MSRWHVLRSEWSPSMGLRQVALTREPVRAAKRQQAWVDAAWEAYGHMYRAGPLLDSMELSIHPHSDVEWLPCDRIEEHVYAIWWHDGGGITTLRLVPAGLPTDGSSPEIGPSTAPRPS